MEDYDILISNKIYPRADNIFTTTVEPVENIIDRCIFVIDTNALLIPYKISSKSLTEIKKVYLKLIQQRRIVIPGQVAREFAKQRPERIKELFQQLNDKKTSISIGKYPLLEDDEDYREALRLESDVNQILSEYKTHISNLQKKIKKWTWNDPVSNIYRELFSPEIVLDLTIDEKKIREDLDYRFKHQIPPGYKDNQKKDNGIGDLLIWFHSCPVKLTDFSYKGLIFKTIEEKIFFSI